MEFGELIEVLNPFDGVILKVKNSKVGENIQVLWSERERERERERNTQREKVIERGEREREVNTLEPRKLCRPLALHPTTNQPTNKPHTSIFLKPSY